MCFLLPLRGQAHCCQTDDLRLSVESRGRGLAWRGRESLSASWGSCWRDRDGLGGGSVQRVPGSEGKHEKAERERGQDSVRMGEKDTDTHTHTHT